MKIKLTNHRGVNFPKSLTDIEKEWTPVGLLSRQDLFLFIDI